MSADEEESESKAAAHDLTAENIARGHDVFKR